MELIEQAFFRFSTKHACCSELHVSSLSKGRHSVLFISPCFFLRLFISQLTTITILLPNTQHPPASHWNLEPKGHLFKSLSQYNNESSLRLLDRMHPHWLVGFDWTLFYGVMNILDYSPTGLLTLLFLLVISHCCSISPGHSLLYPI